MNKKLLLFCNISFNLLWVFILGYFINNFILKFDTKTSILNTIIIMLIWTLRILIGQNKHYKNNREGSIKCLISQFALFTFLFLSIDINIYTACIFTLLADYFLTGYSDIKNYNDGQYIDYKGDIRDLTLWGGNELNIEVFNWVKFNQDNKDLKEYEKKLEETDKKKYFMFKYRFKEFKTFKQISELMEIDERRISEEMNIISHFIEYSIRLKV